jgi:hypothetical protein
MRHDDGACGAPEGCPGGHHHRRRGGTGGNSIIDFMQTIKACERTPGGGMLARRRLEALRASPVGSGGLEETVWV